MAKTRVGVLLRETVGGKNKSNNRSIDLENLQKNQWPAFKKRIQTLIQAIQQHHGNLKRLEESRQMVRAQEPVGTLVNYPAPNSLLDHHYFLRLRKALQH